MPGTQVPPANSFNFVCRRYDWSAELPWLEATYEETVEARPIELDGVVAPTLFIKREDMRERVVALGWTDETERWNAQNAQPSNEVTLTSTDERPKRRRSSRKK